MKEGAKSELYIPPDLAYGKAGRDKRIPPNSALIFEVELLSVDKTPPRPPEGFVPRRRRAPTTTSRGVVGNDRGSPEGGGRGCWKPS